MRIAVLLVSWNSREHLPRCLEALASQTLQPERVLIVDNASSDGSAALAEACLPGASVLRLERNVGFAAANNLAVREAADAEWIALLNPDAFPEPTWLEALAAAARAHPDVACFASQMRSAADPRVLDGAGDVYHVSGRTWRDGLGSPVPAVEERPREVFSACAAAALYRRDAFEAAGGFDESFFCYLEDADLGFRLRLLGHRCLYVPAAVVHHVGSAAMGRHGDFSVYHGHRNLVWTFAKDMPTALLWLYLPQHLLLNLAAVLWFSLRGQAGAIFRSKRDALAGLPRVLRERRRVQAGRRIQSWELRRAMARGLLTPYRAGLRTGAGGLAVSGR